MYKDSPLQVDKCLQFAKDQGIDTSQIPGELGYFIIFPYSYKEIPNHQPITGNYKILTYKDVNITLGELMEQFISSYTKFIGLSNVRFQLSDGRVLHESLTVGKLAKKAELQTLEGLFLYINSIDQKKDWLIKENFETGDDTKIEDECALQQMFTSNSTEDNKSMICIDFQLPGSNGRAGYRITVKRLLRSTFSQFKEELRKKVIDYFDFDLNTLADVKYVILPRSKNEFEQVIKKNEHTRPVKWVNNLSNWCTIRVDLSAKVSLKRKILRPESRLIIEKENSKDFIDVAFEEVQFMYFRNLYRELLVPEKKKKDTSSKMCLKVMDMLIRQDEPLSCLAPFFRHKEQNKFVRLVGKVVSQKMHFYKTMRQLAIDSKEQGFLINKYIRSSVKGEDANKLQDRVRREVRKRAQNSPIPHFKIESHVEPVYIYTCQNIHVNKIGHSYPVYKYINAQLREAPIISLPQEIIKTKFQYLFTSNLMDQLVNIPQKQETVYRGCPYDPQVKKGDILTFKAFASTSIKRQIAQNFKSKYPQSTDRTIFTMHIKSGKNIEKFSEYVSEGERLLQPYTQFEVVNYKQFSEQQGDKKITFREIELNELDEKYSSKQFPPTLSHFVIWVDKPKSEEPEKIYRSITKFNDSTVLIVFNSTQQLEQWLRQEKTKKIFSYKSSNIVFLTNMARVEKNGENPIAGIEAIIKIQKASQWPIPVMLYVGYRKGAQEKLIANSARLQNPKDIKIGTSLDEARRFLADNIMAEFDNIKPNGSKKSI